MTGSLTASKIFAAVMTTVTTAMPCVLIRAYSTRYHEHERRRHRREDDVLTEPRRDQGDPLRAPARRSSGGVRHPAPAGSS